MQQKVVAVESSSATPPSGPPPPETAHVPAQAEREGKYLNETLPLAFWPRTHGVLASSVAAGLPEQFADA
jgi:hypothetical protein